MKSCPSPRDYYYNVTKHSEGPCCLLQYNSTGVIVGGWSAFQNRRLLHSPVSYSLQRALAWKRESKYSEDSPVKHGRDQAPAVIHAYNVWALQLLCSSLLWEVSSYRKQKAGGGENGLKVYLISSARSPAKHTMTERSNSCSLLLQDLPSMAHVAWSICSTDSMLAANKQRLYLSKISPFQVDPMACPQRSVNSCLAVSLHPQKQGVQHTCVFWGKQRPQCHS